MDFTELIKYFTMDYKKMVVSFVVILPLTFCILYAYFPEFQSCDFLMRVIIAIACSVLVSFINFIWVLMMYRAAGLRYKANILYFLFLFLVFSISVLASPRNYKLGYEFLADMFFFFYIKLFFILLLFLFVGRVVVHLVYFIFKVKETKSESEKESESGKRHDDKEHDA